MVSKTTQFYRDNPLSRKKKNAYQKKYNKKPGESEHRAECNKGRKDLGLKKGDKRDASHTKSGKMVVEKRSTNRGRQGAGGKAKKK